MLRTKNLVPMTRLLQGWTITNGLGILWADGRVDQVLLDEPGLCFPDPAAVAITPDGRLALVTSSSTDRVAVVDVAKLIEHAGTGHSVRSRACDPQSPREGRASSSLPTSRRRTAPAAS